MMFVKIATLVAMQYVTVKSREAGELVGDRQVSLGLGKHTETADDPRSW
jgi:hypothetical protein